MSHSDFGDTVIPAIILFVLTASLFVYFLYKRRKTGIASLEILMGIFSITALISVATIFEFYLHERLFVFGGTSAISGLPVGNLTNIPILLQFFLILYLYYVSELFLGLNPNRLRLVFVAALASIVIFFSVYYLFTFKQFATTEVLGFGNPESEFEAFFFDILQFLAIFLFSYSYFLQFKQVKQKRLRISTFMLTFSTFLYAIGVFYQILFHLFPIPRVDEIIFAIPTFICMALFYFLFPTFIYLAPSKIGFIQVINVEGLLIYNLEIKDHTNDTEYLIGPAMMAINQLLNEIMRKHDSLTDIDMKYIEYEAGYLLFESYKELKIIIQVDRPTAIMKSGMNYLLREFYSIFSEQIKDFPGYLTASEDGTMPNELFVKCFPTIEAYELVTS